MSELDALLARKATLLADLAALPSQPTYSIDGQWVDHTAFRHALLNELQKINELIAAAQGPAELPMQAK